MVSTSNLHPYTSAHRAVQNLEYLLSVNDETRTVGSAGDGKKAVGGEVRQSRS